MKIKTFKIKLFLQTNILMQDTQNAYCLSFMICKSFVKTSHMKTGYVFKELICSGLLLNI